MRFEIQTVPIQDLIKFFEENKTALTPAFQSMNPSVLFDEPAKKDFTNTKLLLKENYASSLEFSKLMPNYIIQLLKQKFIIYPMKFINWKVNLEEFLIPTIYIDPQSDYKSFKKQVKMNRWPLEELLLKHGGILIKRSPVSHSDQFSKISKIVYGGSHMFHSYIDGISPRKVIQPSKNGVFTSTEYSSSQEILQHNEMSYSHYPPSKIMFYCSIPPKTDGETPIASSRQILIDIKNSSPELREICNRKITYHTRLPYLDGLGRSWCESYQTTSKIEVEKILSKLGIVYSWDGNELITTRQRKFSRKHLITGDEVWFNHLIIFHSSTLPPLVRKQFEDKIPKDCFFNKDEVISEDVVKQIVEITSENERIFRWEKGDILLLDNQLISHGRKVVTSEREILVTLST
jgi:alpha-ketoglutarate-dependent taurine dioxygenase